MRRIETGVDGYEYEVVPIPGARSDKTYRCPGCDHEIRSGTGHLVVWRSEFLDGEDRRHWHRTCWVNRATRRPARKRS
jgi:hypothetical protein